MLSTILLVSGLNMDFAVDGRGNILTPNQIRHNEITQQNKLKIEQLINDLAMISIENEHRRNFDSVYNENSNKNDLAQKASETILNRVADIENQLYNLGVKELSDSEVMMLYSNSDESQNIIPMISVPPSTSSTRWFSNSYYVYRSEGKYEIQDVYAQAMTTSSSLGKSIYGIVQTESQKLINEFKALASIYAQKAIGAIPIITLMPYEMSFGATKTVQDYETLYHGTLLNQMCYSYVKFETHSSQRLSLVTNQLQYRINLSTHWVYNGIIGGDSLLKQGYTASINYASSALAVSNYLGTTICDFVTGIDIKNYEESITDRITIYCPAAPGLVY